MKISCHSMAPAAECNFHLLSLLRFAQCFGYTVFNQLQPVFLTRPATAAPGLRECIVALESGLPRKSGGGTKGFFEGFDDARHGLAAKSPKHHSKRSRPLGYSGSKSNPCLVDARTQCYLPIYDVCNKRFLILGGPA